MHKPDQGELQLDQSWLSYLEHLGYSVAEGSTAQRRKKAHHNSFSGFSFSMNTNTLVYL